MFCSSEYVKWNPFYYNQYYFVRCCSKAAFLLANLTASHVWSMCCITQSVINFRLCSDPLSNQLAIDAVALDVFCQENYKWLLAINFSLKYLISIDLHLDM